MEERVYYKDEDVTIINDDMFNQLRNIEASSVDLIFADPPYFLSGGGFTCSSGKMVSVDKGKWDKKISLEEKHQFNREWIGAVKEVLKDNGSLFITGTYHNIYSVGMALEEEGFIILNNITWQKTNPPPNLSCRYFTHSTETILWAKKDIKGNKHTFNYKLMKERNGNKQMKDVWSGSTTRKTEKLHGKHPTQKPEYLLENIILAASKQGDLILDPFMGSGTTCLVAKKNGRLSIGIEIEKEYCEIARNRILEEVKKYNE